MFENALERFLMSKKHGIDVKFVQMGPLIAEILTGPFMGTPQGTQGPPGIWPNMPEKHPHFFSPPGTLEQVPMKIGPCALNVNRSTGQLLDQSNLS